ncbi:MAG: acylphosphatase [Spirochaetota bacterium]
MPESDYRSVHLLVSGRVQGVGFRFFSVNHAHRLGLTGWVRNLPDGRVEILAEGDPRSLAAFVEDVREGPSSALVTDVQEEWQDIRAPRHGKFSIAW